MQGGACTVPGEVHRREWSWWLAGECGTAHSRHIWKRSILCLESANVEAEATIRVRPKARRLQDESAIGKQCWSAQGMLALQLVLISGGLWGGQSCCVWF